MTRTIAIAAVAAVTLAIGISGNMDVARAQARSQAIAEAGMPDALRRAAIATRSDAVGEIAGARIGATDFFVVYIRTVRGCGSAGCRAQIWRREGGDFVRGEALPVGRLPIVILPQTSNGMPLLGVTVRTGRNARPAILSVSFDGREYSPTSDRLLPANSGRPLVTQAMMRRF